MANYNRIIMVGNLTRDPVMRYLPNQTPVAEFGLAVNRKYKTGTGEDREEVCFIDCTVFGKSAEIINQYCQKGRPLLVEGRLRYDTWEDKQGGGKRSKHVIMVENFQLMGGRDSGPGGGGGGGRDSGGGYESAGEGGSAPPPPRQSYNRPAPAQGRPPAQAPRQPQPEPPFNEEQQFKDEDIPF